MLRTVISWDNIGRKLKESYKIDNGGLRMQIKYESISSGGEMEDWYGGKSPE